jgi:ferredoxin
LKERERAAISVYAQGRDYHEVMKTKLKALGRFIWDTYRHDLKVFVDTAPLMEKPTAQAVGHGWLGKHTNLVSRQFGSWLFLGEILLSVELPADAPETDHCGHCRACLDICPTKAFPAPYRLDARRCISYLTIEHEGPIDPEFRPLLGNRIYGCDDCLAVCQAGARDGAGAAAGARCAAAGRAGHARRRRLPPPLRRHGCEAHRPRSVPAQCRLCAGQQRRPRDRAAGRRKAAARPFTFGARRGSVGAIAPRARPCRGAAAHDR